ncbi:hypothetical protein HY212_02140 [Candidatus Pacearchaeota archaeon]|nr:hypothetical protein [Candidatus Pacearchaeota archaeon]
MSWKIGLSLVFFIVVISILIVYWFVPLNTTEFISHFETGNGNFENLSNKTLQFYPNMRFLESTISYRIENCPLGKENDMQNAFDTISSLTSLNFYPVNSNEEIHVTCDSKARIEGGLFIAGEGGPVNITKSGEFNVIYNGKIQLLRDSNCPHPNIGIHELLHVLGFDHINNPKSIMYPVSSCDQEVDKEIIDIIDNLYSVLSYPDLELEDVSAVMHGKYLNTNLSLRNNGLKDASKSKILIYADTTLLKELDVDALPVGNGRIITLTNIWVAKLNVDKLRFFVEYPSPELKKENNEVVLDIKN